MVSEVMSLNHEPKELLEFFEREGGSGANQLTDHHAPVYNRILAIRSGH